MESQNVKWVEKKNLGGRGGTRLKEIVQRPLLVSKDIGISLKADTGLSKANSSRLSGS